MGVPNKSYFNIALENLEIFSQLCTISALIPSVVDQFQGQQKHSTSNMPLKYTLLKIPEC
jgi:hypothetical protein